MDFSDMLKELKQGRAAFRTAWGLTGTFIVLVPGSEFTVEEGRPFAAVLRIGVDVKYHPHIDRITDGQASPWSPQQDDILAEDWMVVE